MNLALIPRAVESARSILFWLRRWMLIMAIPALMIACAQTLNDTADSSSEGAATETSLPAQEDEVAGTSREQVGIDAEEDAVGAKLEDASQGPEVAVTPAAIQVEPPIDDDPKKLMGMTRANLSELLGLPPVVRREKPAEIWQYFGSNCVFDIFLYEEQGAYRVIHAEARDHRDAYKTESRACLNQLLRARLEVKPLS